MGHLDSFSLSLTSLMIVFALPFLYFGYHAKYWYRPDQLRKFDFMLQVFCILLAVALFGKMIRIAREGKEAVQLGLLHLGPIVLTLLIVAKSRGSFGSYFPTRKSGEKDTEAPKTNYLPKPSNDQIEALSWDNLIVNDSVKSELQSVIELLKDPKQASNYGIEVPKGILLNGPPGTGKTTVAKVIANTANLSFFVLKMDEVVSKWVGESEKNLSTLFQAATKHKPSVIFIDEVDSIGKQRSGGGQQWAENLLNHLLQLIDGVVKSEGLYIIAAKNRADLVDSALKRAGRLNKVIEIPLPSFEARMWLFEMYLSKLHVDANIDLGVLASLTEGKSGADIKEICNQAGLNAFKRESGSGRREYSVTLQDIELALSEFLSQAPVVNY